MLDVPHTRFQGMFLTMKFPGTTSTEWSWKELDLQTFANRSPEKPHQKLIFRGVPVQPPSYTQHNILGGAKCYIFGPFWANLATKFLKYFLKNTKNAQFNLIQSPNTSNMTKTCESVHKRSKKMQIKSCLYPKNESY